jgi:hypothetical protein
VSRDDKLQNAVDAAAKRVLDEMQNKKDVGRELRGMPGMHDAFKTADRHIKQAKKDLKKAVKKQNER